MENQSACFYFSENLFLTKFNAMITTIIGISSVSINIHCYNMHFSINIHCYNMHLLSYIRMIVNAYYNNGCLYQRINLKEDFVVVFLVQIYHDPSFVMKFNLAA